MDIKNQNVSGNATNDFDRNEAIPRAASSKYQGIVYHYCSLDAFMSILSTKTIRATNIKKSNDLQEITAYRNEFSLGIKSACLKYKSDNPNDEVFAEFLQNLLNLNGLDFRQIVDDAIDNEANTYYCICFSEKGDLLSQWRGYANDGTGVAIGFKEKYLFAPTQEGIIKYHEVVYNAGDIIRKKIEDAVVENFKIAREQFGNETHISDYENVILKAISAIVYNAVFYKNAAFAEEKERRLVLYPFGRVKRLRFENYVDWMEVWGSYRRNFDKWKRSELQFMQRGNQLVSYVDLDFSEYLPYLIPEIILGPKCKIDDMELKLFLHKNGIDIYHTRILKSKAPYR